MTKSGSKVYEGIKHRIYLVETEHGEFSREIYGYEENISILANERENIYVQLATTYLPQMDAESIKNTIHEVQEEVQKIFNNRKQRRQTLEQLMSEIKDKEDNLRQKLGAVNEQLEKKVDERESLKKNIGLELDSDQDYAQLGINARQSGERLNQNKKRHEIFKSESRLKLNTYHDNPLFMYLVRREFGTPNHDGNFLTWRLDRLVAALISYQEQKKNYDFLVSMPEAIKKEIDTREKEVLDLMSKMKKIEEIVEKKYGLPKVMEEGLKLGKRRENILLDINKSDEQHSMYSKEIMELDNTKGGYHKEAVKSLKDYLKGNDLAALKARARSTKGSEDDRLVDRIEEIDISIKKLKATINDSKKRQDGLASKLNDLKNIGRRYTEKDYESKRSYFPGDFDIDFLLMGYIAGQLNDKDVNSTIDKNQKFKPRETYSHSTSHSSYDSSPSYGSGSSDYSSGGGFDSSSFSSGGGFGGGFSTGGGF